MSNKKPSQHTPLSFTMLSISLRNLKRHKSRTILSMLGIIIGVFAICSLGMTGAAFTESINDMLDKNANMLIITSSIEQDGRTDSSLTPQLSEDDINRIERAVKAVTPDYKLVRMHFGTKSVEIGHDKMIAGVLFGEKENANVLVGGTITEGKLPRMDTDVVILTSFAENNKLKVGSHIKTASGNGEIITLKVTGIMDDTLLSRVFSITLSSNLIICTNELYDALTGTDTKLYRYALLQVEDINMITPIANAIEREMNGKSNKTSDNKVDIKNVADLVMELRNILSLSVVLCIAISAIALLVASVSITNIMIVSVRERTREIGIMRSIGTKRNQVVQTFLFEAGLIGLFGAIVGVLLACLTVGAFLIMLMNTASYLLLPTVWIFIPLGILIGVGVCVMSGLYPAVKAAHLNPVEAMAEL